jgi:hypothetical protein
MTKIIRERKKIEAAAILLDDGTVLTLPRPARHPSLILEAQKKGLSTIGHMQGFLTEGDFVDREEAFIIALESGQHVAGEELTSEQLYTEDLW